MRLRYLPAFITLTAGTITCIISIVRHADTLKSLKTLLLVLILFYIIGLTARNIITRVLESNGDESKVISDNGEELAGTKEDENSLEENSESVNE